MADILFVNTTDSHRIKHEVNGTMLLASIPLREGFDADVLRAGVVEGWEEDYDLFLRRAMDKMRQNDGVSDE